MKLLFALMLSLFLLSSAQAQQPVRLKKTFVAVWSSSNNSYKALDSTLYYYSGNNTGYFHNQVFYNNKNGFPWVEFTNENIAEYLAMHSSLLYDSAIRHRKYSAYAPHGKYVQTLANNKIIRYTRYTYHTVNSHWIYERSLRNVYTGNLLTQQVDSGLNNNLKSTTYKYVNNNPLTPDSMITTYPGGQAAHTYTYNNNLLTEINTYYNIGTHYKYLYTYSSSGMPTQIMTLFYNSNTTNWDTQIVQKYMYNNNLMTRHEYWTDTTLTFTVDAQYDNNNNRIEDIIHVNDLRLPHIGFVKHARKQYTYNNFGLISEYKLDHWDSASQTWMPKPDSLFNTSHTVKLQYEVFWPQNITNTQNQTNNITIYPSPAEGFITVQMPDLQSGDVEMSIHNMNGQTMRRWKEKVGNQGYSRTIPVQELPTGMYILKLNGQHTAVSKQFNIIN